MRKSYEAKLITLSLLRQKLVDGGAGQPSVVNISNQSCKIALMSKLKTCSLRNISLILH